MPCWFAQVKGVEQSHLSSEEDQFLNQITKSTSLLDLKNFYQGTVPFNSPLWATLADLEMDVERRYFAFSRPARPKTREMKKQGEESQEKKARLN